MSYELGDTVTVTITAPVDADVDLHVTAPDGTETTPTATNVMTTWSASFVANQLGGWQYAFIVTGSADNVELGTVQVGEPRYSTLTLLRQALGMAATDTTRDALLDQALTGASRSVDQFCDGRHFYLDATVTARTFGTGRVIRTSNGSQLPVDDIGSTSGLIVEVGDGTTWTATTAYETHPDNALARRLAITALVAPTANWCSTRRVRVTARWGWPAIPSAVSQATLLQATRLYRRKDSPEGVAGSADWGLVRVPNLDPDVKALLAPYTSGLLVH